MVGQVFAHLHLSHSDETLYSFWGGGVLLQSGESAIVNSTLYLAHRAKLQEHLPEKNVASTVNHQFSGKIELVLHKSFKRTGPK